MEIFHPADMLEVAIQMAAFFCWAFAARMGWRYADWMLQKFGELRRVLSRKKEKP